MATFQSKGIVFKNIKYGESSIICDIFTEAKGLRSYIVSGIRSGKSSQKANIYRPLQIVNIHAYDAEGNKLARIKDIHYEYMYQHVNYQVLRSSMALFMLEIARNSIKSTDSDGELYHFLESRFIHIDQCEKVHALEPVFFMIHLSAYLGFEPLHKTQGTDQVFDLLNGCFTQKSDSSPYFMDEEITIIFREMLKKETLNDFPVPVKAVRLKMLDHMITYFKLHISGFKDILSKDVLAGVL